MTAVARDDNPQGPRKKADAEADGAAPPGQDAPPPKQETSQDTSPSKQETGQDTSPPTEKTGQDTSPPTEKTGQDTSPSKQETSQEASASKRTTSQDASPSEHDEPGEVAGQPERVETAKPAEPERVEPAVPVQPSKVQPATPAEPSHATPEEPLEPAKAEPAETAPPRETALRSETALPGVTPQRTKTGLFKKARKSSEEAESDTRTEPAPAARPTEETESGTRTEPAPPARPTEETESGTQTERLKEAEPGEAESQRIPSPRHAAADGEGDGDEAGEEEDAFAKFAPSEGEILNRRQRAARRVGAFFAHEWTLAALGATLLAVVMTWPTLKYPAHTIPQDVWDPTLVSWMMAWSGHAVLTDVGNLWNANGFYPEQLSYAFTDSLLGYFPAGLIGEGFTAALIRYNIIYVLLHALAFFGAYALVRQLGAGRTGAAVAGAAFAYAPWRLAQAGHMHIISTGGIALALAMIARGHGYSLRHGYQPDKRKPAWAFAGWLVAAWQISLGFGIGLPFAYVMAGLVVVSAIMLLVRRLVKGPFAFGGKLFLADLFGGLVFAAVGVLMALPYLRVAELHPYAVRSEAEVALYSPPLYGFFVSPGESATWGASTWWASLFGVAGNPHGAARDTLSWHPEMTLLAGFVLYGLAFAGLIMSIWSVRQRIILAAGVGLSILLAMGTEAFKGGRPGYMTLYDLLPGWDALRTSGRLVLWTTLLLGILAAGAVCAFVEQAVGVSRERVPARPHPMLRLATLIPVMLVLIEGLNNTPHPTVPKPPPTLATVQGPLLVLPSDQLRDEHVMLWLTDTFPKMVNGGSGFTPQRTAEIREVTKTFPDAASVTMLREIGVRTVVVLKGYSTGTPYEAALTAPVDGLDVKREEKSDAVVFILSGESGSPR